MRASHLSRTLCRARTRIMALSWCFLWSSGCSPILVDQPVDDLPARDPGCHIDRLASAAARPSRGQAATRALVLRASRSATAAAPEPTLPPIPVRPDEPAGYQARRAAGRMRDARGAADRDGHQESCPSPAWPTWITTGALVPASVLPLCTTGPWSARRRRNHPRWRPGPRCTADACPPWLFLSPRWPRPPGRCPRWPGRNTRWSRRSPRPERRPSSSTSGGPGGGQGPGPGRHGPATGRLLRLAGRLLPAAFVPSAGPGVADPSECSWPETT
jgi:hypothetical protein